MDMDGPLDFESEDPLLQPLAPTTKRRKKLIGLDDLVNDYFKENKKLEMKSKKAKARKNYNSDEDEDCRESRLSEFVDKCQKEMGKIIVEEENHLWGLQVFGNQKTQPLVVFCEPGSCELLQSFLDNQTNSLVGLEIEEGEVFLKRLLVNGWLLKLAYARGGVDKAIATWTFGLMLYSSDEVLSASACDFWTTIILPRSKIKIDWSPNYSTLKEALEIYGFLLDLPSQISSNMGLVNADSECGGPPHNIRAWVKFVASCVQVRSTNSIFSTLEAEELVVVIICLCLDRQLLGLSVILHECMLSVINFFTDTEWNDSCEKVAKSISCRIPRDMNCLRTVESIYGVNARSKHLRHAVAFHMLLACLDNKATDAEEILRLLVSVNVKDKACDLYKMYIYLVLTENWISSNAMLEDKQVVHELWGIYLRNCSSQITSTDLRSYASKVRSKASYLLQETNNK